jgi:hypothetical protein
MKYIKIPLFFMVAIGALSMCKMAEPPFEVTENSLNMLIDTFMRDARRSHFYRGEHIALTVIGAQNGVYQIDMMNISVCDRCTKYIGKTAYNEFNIYLYINDSRLEGDIPFLKINYKEICKPDDEWPYGEFFGRGYIYKEGKFLEVK